MPSVTRWICPPNSSEPKPASGRSPAARARAASLGNSSKISPVASASRCPEYALPAMRHDLLGEQGHRLPDQGMIHDPALVEIANEFVHSVFAFERAHPFDAEIRIAEDTHLALDVLVANLLDAGEHLAERLETADVGLADRPQPLAGFAQKPQQSWLCLLPRLRTARRDVHRESKRGVALCAGAQSLAIALQAGFEPFGRIDQRRGENRQTAPPCERKSLGAVGGDAHRRVGCLYRTRDHTQITGTKIFAVERKRLALPRRQDEVERFLEALAALFLRDIEPDVIERERAAPDPEFEPSIAEDVGGRGLLDDLHRAMQRQQGYRGAEPDAAGSLPSCRQDHQRIGKDRERPAEVKLSEPRGIEAKLVAELDLREDVAVALALGVAARTRQLVEEAEAHLFFLTAYLYDAPLTRRISRRRSRSNRQPREGSQPDRESFVAAVGGGLRNSRGSTAWRPWRNSKCSWGSLTLPVEPTRAMTCPRATLSPRFTSS